MADDDDGSSFTLSWIIIDSVQSGGGGNGGIVARADICGGTDNGDSQGRGWRTHEQDSEGRWVGATGQLHYR
ncbi:MAG TPA: hypothetical protein EYQ31_01675 [Candidatus Handelsmanbacteria bacterium]|nr:hypothetical protein [Candidatus Handelsmanbacteria bacterium]